MNPFELARPVTLREASELLSGRPGEQLALAGGQDLLALMKDYVLTPTRLVDLKSLPNLDRIEVDRAGNLSLGALVTLAEVADSEVVRKGWPVLAQAAGEAATPQIRNLGTVGGNLCQKPRCWYYRAEELRCWRKGGQTCLAADGDHRYHAVLGGGSCLAPNFSALANPATACGGKVAVFGPNGARELALPEFYAPVLGNQPRDHALAPDELVTGLLVPPLAGWRAAHEEVRFKQSHDWPIAMATAVLRLDGGRVREARLVLGAVAPVPYLAADAAAVLRGRPLTAALAEQAAEAVARTATPLALNAYKVTVMRHLIRRVLLSAAGLGEG